MSTVSSLVAPHDRDRNAVPTVAANIDPLNQEELNNALMELTDESVVKELYPRLERYYADPLYNGQVYCLHSFMPSKGSKPDEHGVYGFMKCRGAFQTIDEANQRANYIIRHYDSINPIHTSYCGKPFPVCKEPKKYIQETSEVDLKEDMQKTISNNVQEKRRKDEKEMAEIKEREQRLIEENKPDHENPLDDYTTLRVKKANQVFAHKQAKDRLKELEKSIKATKREILKMEKIDPSHRDLFILRYNQARQEAGLYSNPEDSEDNFINYLLDDRDPV